jgi:hypothetical protein
MLIMEHSICSSRMVTPLCVLLLYMSCVQLSATIPVALAERRIIRAL